MPGPYSPLAVANYFIDKHGKEGGIEHMKLQKLVYCAHGWWLAFHDEPFVDSSPEVWRHGPVFSGLYHTMKPFGRDPIKDVQSPSPFDDPAMIAAQDKEAAKLLDWVWNRYGHLSSFALSSMTHEPGTPWHRLANEHDFAVPLGLEIPDEYIAEEFKKIYKAEEGEQQAAHS